MLFRSKADLCDLNETMKWVKKYENDGYKVILANLNNTKDITKIMKQTEEIINKINDKNASKGLNKRKIKSLVIGIPNVGKSTFINYLAAKKVASVGNNPGITKNNTWLNTKYNMLVLDTPGILWPKLENKTEAMNLASTGAIKSEILPVNDVGLYILEFLSNYYPCILKEKYGINKITSIEEDYKTIADKLNVKSKIEDIDYQKINNIIINDIKSEKTKNITLDRG